MVDKSNGVYTMNNELPSEKEILKKLDDALTGLDQQRANGLDSLKTLQAVRDDGAQREKIRLANKYGADHPRVKKVADRLAYNQGLEKELDNEIERNSITIPDFDVNTWMVHGGIVDGEGTPLSGLTVSLYDENGSWIEKLGYGCTDERGYFVLKYTAKSREASAIQDTQKLILTVTDSNGLILHQETDPLYLNIGQIDYRLMVITAKGETCPPPASTSWDSEELTSDAWVVSGKVVDQKQQPICGLTVSLYDKDLIFDDVLGTTLTDSDGNFKMVYRTEAFGDLFSQKPDIYLKVLDKSGKTLYGSRKAVRSQAGREEPYDIKIKKNADDIKT